VNQYAESFEFADGVVIIADNAFSGCRSLTSITIPESVMNIGDGALSFCRSLTSITVDENNAAYQDIDGNLYSKDGTTLLCYPMGKTDTAFTIPDGVTIIGDYAFSGCKGLISVSIGNNVTSIGEAAFFYCSSLTEIVIPDGVTTIGTGAFCGTGLTEVIIPDSVTTIGEIAFDDCSNLRSVVIGNGVYSIGNNAFRGCTNLTSVEFKDTTTWYWGYVLGGTNTLLSSSNLADKSIAAQYLRSTYYMYFFTKK
jgi:hypothetical protein